MPYIKLTIARVPNIAVNIEVKIPMDNVIAKPFIGPVPIVYRTSDAINVVTFASKIVTKAREKPSLIALCGSSPALNSSLILQKINTLASTAIPIVKTIPAIPGKVKVAPSNDIKPVIKTTLANKAKFAARPNHL